MSQSLHTATRHGPMSHECRSGDVPAIVRVSRFVGASGAAELHVSVEPTVHAAFEAQLGWVRQAYEAAMRQLGAPMSTAVFRRFMCSDLINQAAWLEAQPIASRQSPETPCAISWVGEPPAGAAKVALWAYHVVDPDHTAHARDNPKHGLQANSQDHKKDWSQDGVTLTLRRGELAHHWTTGVTHPHGDSHAQTHRILEHYESFLDAHQLTLADHVVRTWFFVRDVDANYRGLVEARRAYFEKRGLTADTHYIASTGIEGQAHDVRATVSMDAYAITGVRPEQISYIEALDHLSPTHVYGVTFERATAIDYRDRRHVFISGTASIDRQGRIVHPGDVSRQLARTIENIDALLAQAGATTDDLAVLIVYLRDPADQAVIAPMLRERFGDLPLQIVIAPVCRPGWLIEIEGIAIVPTARHTLPPF